MSTEQTMNENGDPALNLEQTQRLTALKPALAIMLIGAAMVLFTLFAPVAQVHNATHDTRHAVVAPCH